MKDVLHLALQYLLHHRYKTLVLVASITLILYVPAGLRVMVAKSQSQLRARAASTPLLLGAKGSPLELVLNALYFGGRPPPPLPFEAWEELEGSGLARAIPLHARFRAGSWPIVGTGLDYFGFRGLRLEQGRFPVRLGECVLGSRAARSLGAGVGDAVVSSPETAFDLAGVYPLRMQVSGVLAPTGGPDDDAVFTDVKTTWVIEGLGHGHQDVSKPEAAEAVLAQEEDHRVANASLRHYNEITEENIDFFHFHGERRHFPLTALLVVPPDRKSAALLLGRFQTSSSDWQLLEPRHVMAELLETVLTIEGFVLAALLGVGVATFLTAALVFLLSLRLRRGELETMARIGASPVRVAAVCAAEVLGVLTASMVLAGVLTWWTWRAGDLAIGWLAR